MKSLIVLSSTILILLNTVYSQDTIHASSREFLIDKSKSSKINVYFYGLDHKIGHYEPILSEDSLTMGYIFYDRSGERNFRNDKTRNGEVLAIVSFKLGVPLRDSLILFSGDERVNYKNIRIFTEIVFPNKFLKAQLVGRLKIDSIIKIFYGQLYEYRPVSHGTIYRFSDTAAENFSKRNETKFTNFLKRYYYRSEMYFTKKGERKFLEKKINYYEAYHFESDLERPIYINKILGLTKEKFRKMYEDYQEQKNYEAKVTSDWHRIANSDGIDEILAKYLK